MVEQTKAKRITRYTTQQRHELTEQFTRVLDRCPDLAFGRALSAAAKAINKSATTV